MRDYEQEYRDSLRGLDLAWYKLDQFLWANPPRGVKIAFTAIHASVVVIPACLMWPILWPFVALAFWAFVFLVLA